jgi:hypothetical protein
MASKKSPSERVVEANGNGQSPDQENVGSIVGSLYKKIKVDKTITPTTLTDAIYPKEIGVKKGRVK